MLRSKKAQISETMTWIVATIVIIISLSFFVFLANVLAQGGAIKNAIDSTFSKVTFELDKEVNFKTELAFGINPANKQKIDKWIGVVKKTKEREYDIL